MSTIREIEDAVRKLPPDDLAAFRHWFAEFDADMWDRQIERDVAAERLDKLANEATEGNAESRNDSLAICRFHIGVLRWR